MVKDERCEKALRFLASTDEQAAVSKADVARAEYAAKLARARVFLLSEGGSVEARKAAAEQSADVQHAENKVADAIEAYEKLRARRTTEELVIEVWRSCGANRRAGNV